MGVAEHKARAPRRVRCFVVTVSDSRTEETDSSGRAARELLESAGHEVVGSRIVKDEPADVAALVRGLAEAGAAEAIVLNGGTGVGRRDTTVEAIAALIDKPLPGFGELFRALSFEEIGAAAMLSRAVGGLFGGVVLFAMPGSTAAVRLAVGRLIAPELGHLVGEAQR